MRTKPKDSDLFPSSDHEVLGKERLSVSYDVLFQDSMKELNEPLRLHATFPTPDANLNIESSQIILGDGAERNLPPIKSKVLSIPASTVNFQTNTNTGATFVVAWPPSTIGQFRRAGFTLMTAGAFAGFILIDFSVEAPTLGALPDPGTLFTDPFAKGGIPLGYVDLEGTASGGPSQYKTAGSATNVIENSGIHRFGGPKIGLENAVYTTSNPLIPNQNDDELDGYVIGDTFINTNNNRIFQAVDVTTGAAIWKRLDKIMLEIKNFAILDMSVNNVNDSAYTEIIADVGNFDVRRIQAFYPDGDPALIAVGGVGAEVDEYVLTAGGNVEVGLDVNIPANSRISIKLDTGGTTNTSGKLVMNFLGES